MPITVRFRGPMLFVTDNLAGKEIDDVVDCVVIPDATQPGVHDDGSSARPHTAALLLIEHERPRVYIPLRGRRVTISAEGESHPPTVDDDYLHVPPIHEMTNPLGASGAPASRRSSLAGAQTLITIEGGGMTGDLFTDTGIELPRHKKEPLLQRLCSMPVWLSEAERGRIVIDGGPDGAEVIELNESVEVYIYNWDTAFPTKQELYAQLDVASTFFQDDDFKWIYRLLDPPESTWKGWLDGELYLPAPRTHGFLGGIEPSDAAARNATSDIAASPPVSTCDSARCRGLSVA